MTKSNWFIIGWIAALLGILMDGIFYGINAIGLPNVSLAIILFTIVIYAAMTPITVKMQRFSKLNAVMAPELEKVRKKYAGKTDQESQQRMMDENQAVYRKYGVSPMGSCLQAAIQMPILFALYQVIYHIPGYITLIGQDLTKMVETTGFTDFFSTVVKGFNNSTLNAAMTSNPTTANYVDTLYQLNTSQWTDLLGKASGQSFQNALTQTHAYITRVTNFFGLNISDTPMTIFTGAWADKAFLIMLVAVLFPVLSWFTQWMSVKLMPQAAATDGEPNAMANSMKSMNLFMPVISAVFCFTLPVGVGIYWIIGGVIRLLQQLVINNKLDHEDINEIIAAAQKKAAKKAEKKGVSGQTINRNAQIRTRSLEADNAQANAAQQKKAELQERLKRADAASSAMNSAPEGSLASKANMVARFDEKNVNQKRSGGKKKN